MATQKSSTPPGVDALARLNTLLADASAGRLSGRIVDVPASDPLFPACISLNGLLDRVELVNRDGTPLTPPSYSEFQLTISDAAP